MHAKKTAIGAVAIASSFMFSSAAQADLLNIDLFPRSSRDAVIETPAVIPVAPINSCSTTVVPTVVTRSALVPPLARHDMIRAVPATINDCPAPLGGLTLPAVIESQSEVIVPVVDSGADYAAPTAVIDTLPVHTLPAGISLINSQRELPAVIGTTLAEPAVMPSLAAITAPSPLLPALPSVTDPTVMPAFPAFNEIYGRPTFSAVVESNVRPLSLAVNQPSVLQGAPVGRNFYGHNLPALIESQSVFSGVIEPSVTQAAPLCSTCEPLVQPAIIQAAPLCGTSCAPAISPVMYGQNTLPAVVPSLSRTGFERLSLRETSFGLNQSDRLVDMMDQVRLGQSRGWLTTGELALLTAERDRIAQLINTFAPGGLTASEADQLDSALTLFNQQIVSELNDNEGSIAGFTGPL